MDGMGVALRMAGEAGLADYLDRLNWSPERLAREVNRLCGEGTVSAKAPYHWVRGTYPRRGIPEVVARVLSSHLKETVEIASIWPKSGAGPRNSGAHPQPIQPDPEQLPSPLIKDACTSARLVQDASETNADESTLLHLNRELDDISSAYLHMPPRSLVYRAGMLRDRLGRLLQGRQKPAQRRELLALGAKSCVLLAWMSEDLGDTNAAYNQAQSAWELAELAEDAEASRWVRAVQSRQAYWLRNYIESAERATDGLARPGGGDRLRLSLLLLAARAWAGAGADRAAGDALDEWRDTAAADAPDERPSTPADPDGQPGLLEFGPDRQHYLVGHTLLRLGRPEEALHQLRAALDRAERLPAVARFYGIEPLARADMLRAHLRLGEPERAEAVLEPVFALEPQLLINMLVLTLRDLTLDLLRAGREHPRIRDIAERIREFLDFSLATAESGLRES